MPRPSLLTFLLLLGLSAAGARGQVLLGSDPYNAQLRVMDLQGNLLATTVLFLDIPGSVYDGTNGVARHPLTGQIFVCFDASSVGLTGRGLGIVGPMGTTTEVALVGDLGDRFSALVFDSVGTLYGVTGENANAPESLYTIDTATAAKTLVAPLGNGGDGEALAFNPGDGLLYHASGGVLGGPAVWESVDPANGMTTSIGYQPSTLPDHEVFGLVHDPATGEFIALDLDQQLVSLSTSGVKTPIADLSALGFSFFIRGFAIIDLDAFPGTPDDLTTTYSRNLAAPRVVPWGGSAIAMNAGDTLSVNHESVSGNLNQTGALFVYGSYVPTTSVPTFPEIFPGLHVDLAAAFAVFGGTIGGLPLGLPPGGFGYGFSYGGGFAGNSIVLQAAVSTGSAENGIFASSHGLQIDFH